MPTLPKATVENGFIREPGIPPHLAAKQAAVLDRFREGAVPTGLFSRRKHRLKRKQSNYLRKTSLQFEDTESQNQSGL
jgi:hypothetical protein